MNNNYDAVLILSFGGPEGIEDISPFLDHVLKDRNVPESRKQEVAHHYELAGGISPINEQNRSLITALRQELSDHDIEIPLYWGNRNWHPFIEDTMRQMKEEGIERALAFVTSAYSSYSGCRQYLEDIQRAQTSVGNGAPQIDKLRVFFNHPGFIEANAEHIIEAMQAFPVEQRKSIQLVFTAHSIPIAMAQHCAYQSQLLETCELVARLVDIPLWDLVFQSRSGSPSQPWLEPDVCDHLKSLKNKGIEEVIISPIGFISDHMEVLFDLDIEAQEVCNALGLHMERAKSVGIHPKFIAMIRSLIMEQLDPNRQQRAMGELGPWHSKCPKDCCLPS